MGKIPENCSRCGAPISWEEEAASIKCEFCGYKNTLKPDFYNLFISYLNLRNPKQIIRHPISRIILLLLIPLFLIINSKTGKEEKVKVEYWPTNFDELKRSYIYEEGIGRKVQSSNINSVQKNPSSENEPENNPEISTKEEYPEAAKEYLDRILQIYQVKGKEKETIKLSTIVLTLTSNPFEKSFAYWLRAYAKYELADYAGAIKDHNEAIKVRPDNIDAFNNRAYAKLKIGDYLGAVNDFTNVIKSSDNPETISQAYSDRGYAKSKIDNYSGAIGDYTIAINSGMKNARIYYNRAFAKRKLNDIQGSLKDYTRSINIDPNFRSYLNRGTLKKSIGDKEGSCFDLQKAKSLGSKSAGKYLRDYCN